MWSWTCAAIFSPSLQPVLETRPTVTNSPPKATAQSYDFNFLFLKFLRAYEIKKIQNNWEYFTFNSNHACYANSIGREVSSVYSSTMRGCPLYTRVTINGSKCGYSKGKIFNLIACFFWIISQIDLHFLEILSRLIAFFSVSLPLYKR